MADVRMTGAALLTTVTTVADTATSLINSVGTGAKMLNAFADDAAWKQAKRLAVSKVGYEDNLKTSKAIEIAQSRQALHTYVKDNPDQAEEIKAIVAELEKALG